MLVTKMMISVITVLLGRKHFMLPTSVTNIDVETVVGWGTLGTGPKITVCQSEFGLVLGTESVKV